MFRTRFALSFLAAALGCATAGAAAAQKPPLDYTAYDGWNAIRGTVLSTDGRYAAYALVPEDGDGTLVVHDFKTGTDTREARGIDPAFTADGRFLVFSIAPTATERHAADKAHKKPDEGPQGGLGILDLTTLTTTTIARVKSVVVPRDSGSDTIAFVRSSPAPSASPLASSSPAASPLPAATKSAVAALSASPSSSPPPSPSPSPSASPDALHAKTDGNDLVVRDLAAGVDTTIPHVSSVAIAHDGLFVAYAVTSKDGATDALRLRASSTGVVTVALTGAGHYTHLTFAPKTERLAFLSDVASFAEKAPHQALYDVDLENATLGPARKRADATTPGMPNGFAPSDDATPTFARDGSRLVIGTAPVPTPVPSGTPEPMKVDIWNWRDGALQSYQRKNADDERKRTYASLVDLSADRVVQLGSPHMREVQVVAERGVRFALGSDDRPYRASASWDEEAADRYAIALDTGARRLLVRKDRDTTHLAPTGAYVAAYDLTRRVWYAVSCADGHRMDLTAKLHVAFYDELDDHPEPPPPYTFGGWVDGDRYALVLDRYDVWAVDPRTGAARNLTLGIGRRRQIRFSPLQLDPDATSYDSGKPIVLMAHDDRTKAEGLWSLAVRPTGALREIVMLQKAVLSVKRARAADRIVVTERRFDEAANLWSAPAPGARFARFSDANPQQTRYAWGHARLISYRSTWGAPLQGILIEPERRDPVKKLPMLVYLYERFSDDLHTMPFTTPAPNTSPTLVRYVSNGYVVLIPDIAYRVGHPGASALGCVLPAVDRALALAPVDPQRIGIAGHSWGAYQIAYMIAHTNRFRAAEAGAAVANMTSAYGGIRLESGVVREAQYERGQSRIGATPWDRPELYLENSALFHVRTVNTPYITIANDLDGAVPWQQGIEFFTALRRLGKEAYMFQFDGEDHNLRGREQQKYWTVHLDEFFDHFLKGAPAPPWMTQGVDFLHRGERNIHGLYGENW